MKQNPRKYSLNILRNKFQTASSFLKQIPRRTPVWRGISLSNERAGYMTERPQTCTRPNFPCLGEASCIKGRQGRQPSLPGTRPNLPGPGGASCIKGRQGRQPSLSGTRPNFPCLGGALIFFCFFSCIKARKEEGRRRSPIESPYKIRIAISAQASASAKA